MKLMTEVKSTVTGIVTAVNVTNEAVVGYDDALFTVVPF
jgi:acetyl-CoA carboxylase biotin carboxyl carrier protein